MGNYQSLLFGAMYSLQHKLHMKHMKYENYLEGNSSHSHGKWKSI